MDVGLAVVLFLLVAVGLMTVLYPGVVVVVLMSRIEVGPLLTMRQVMDHVVMVVVVDGLAVLVTLVLGFATHVRLLPLSDLFPGRGQSSSS